MRMLFLGLPGFPLLSCTKEKSPLFQLKRETACQLQAQPFYRVVLNAVFKMDTMFQYFLLPY